MKKIIHQYKTHFTQKKFIYSMIIGWAFFIVSLIINYYAGTYATEKASSSVTDIILSNTRVYDVDGMFVYGAVILVSSIALLCVFEPKRFPFILKNIALFVMVRSVYPNKCREILLPSNFLQLPFLYSPEFFYYSMWHQNLFAQKRILS